MRRLGRGRAATVARVRNARRGGHGRVHERPRGALPPHAHRDAAGRAPERLAGRPAERARRPGRGARRLRAVRASRREARALRGPQPADGLRPGRVHPLQPLRALHAGGDAVLGALARGTRAGRADRADLGALLARHRVRALRGLPGGVPDRRDPREVPRGRARRPRAAAREGEDDVHVLRGRLPARPQRRPGDEADREGDLGAALRLQRGQPLRQGPLLLQLRPPPRPADRAARARRGRRAARGDVGGRARPGGGGPAGGDRPPRPAVGRRSSPPPG